MSSSYLTPLSMVFFVFAVCASYMFISSNSMKHNYTGDNKFIMLKLMMVISTIAMGFIATITSVSWYILASKVGNQTISGVLTALLDFSRNSVVTTLLLYLSSIWFALAVALLPFGHTVYVGNTNSIDADRTKQLVAVQQTVYSMPFHALLVIMALNLLAFIAVCTFMFVGQDNSASTALATAKIFTKAVPAVRPTLGWYFKFDGTEWDSIKSRIGSGGRF